MREESFDSYSAVQKRQVVIPAGVKSFYVLATQHGADLHCDLTCDEEVAKRFAFNGGRVFAANISELAVYFQE